MQKYLLCLHVEHITLYMYLLIFIYKYCANNFIHVIIHHGLIKNIVHPRLSTENATSKEIKNKNENI